MPRASRSSSFRRDVGHKYARNSQGTNPRTGATIRWLTFWDFGSHYQEASRRQTASCCGSGKHSLEEDVAASLQPTVAAAAVLDGFGCCRLDEQELTMHLPALSAVLTDFAQEHARDKMSVSFANPVLVQLDSLRPTKTMSISGQRTSRRKLRNCTLLHSVRSSPYLLKLHRRQG